jgi:hypothetical protein
MEAAVNMLQGNVSVVDAPLVLPVSIQASTLESPLLNIQHQLALQALVVVWLILEQASLVE